MNRMDEIKIKLKDTAGVTGEFSDEDVQYLLSKLEIAEKALEDVTFETDVPVSDIQAIKRISSEALQQLRS